MKTSGFLIRNSKSWLLSYDMNQLRRTMFGIAEAFSVYPQVCIAVGMQKRDHVCGAAVGCFAPYVLRCAMAGDPIAISGGLIFANFVIGSESARILSAGRPDGVIASGFTREAILQLRSEFRQCHLLQDGAVSLDPNTKTETKVEHAYGENIDDMFLALAVGLADDPNLIVLVKDGMLIGNAVDDAELAINVTIRSKHRIKGSVAFVGSFSRFPNGPEVLIDAGVKTILTTSASAINNEQTIALCAERGVDLYVI